MSWQTTTPMTQRTDFIALALLPDANLSELCRRFGVSRRTGHKMAQPVSGGRLRCSGGSFPAAPAPHFGACRRLYNHERPHQAIDDQAPASRYALSPRP